MNLSIIIKDDKQDLGIYLGEDNINVLVNSISDIYPKMSKKYEKLLKEIYFYLSKYINMPDIEWIKKT